MNSNGNKLADKAATEAASTLPKHLTKLYTDVCGYIKQAIRPKWQRAWNRSRSGRSLFQHILKVLRGKYKSTLSKDHEARLIKAKTGYNKLNHIFTSLILLTLICLTVERIHRTLNTLSCIAPFTRSIVMR